MSLPMKKKKKNTSGFGNNRLITLLCWSVLFFSNCNNRWMMFAHARILLSFMQRIDKYLVALKEFDYFCSLVYKRPITSKR